MSVSSHLTHLLQVTFGVCILYFLVSISAVKDLIDFKINNVMNDMIS